MEPNYLADNEYIDAFVVAWLFQEDHLFFNDWEIEWDGQHHVIKGIETNAANMDEIPTFMLRRHSYLNCVYDFLMKLEQQEDLIVPRSQIHSALHGAIRMGDLTGLTLFNLLACEKAMAITRKDPSAYVVMYDTNLSKGIPRFSELVGKLVKFMREYNDVEGDFTVSFVGSRNIDFAMAFLGGDAGAVENPVAGAAFEPTLSLRSGEGYVYMNAAGERVHSKGGLEASDLEEAPDATQAIDEQPEPARRAQVNPPNYIGANKRIDAMAVAWLFAHDYVFFNQGDITWNGARHAIVGAQINSDKVDEIPMFMSNAQVYYRGIGDFLMTLEQDNELIVPRSTIHRGLHDAICEGNLTGITLFNLQACGRAFQFLEEVDERAKYAILRTAGFGELADDPNAIEHTYMIFVDERLARGIPGFYKLVRRLFEDMRAYNEADSRCILVFTTARNPDADRYLNDFGGIVEGAVFEGLHVEMVDWGQVTMRSSRQTESKEATPASDEHGDGFRSVVGPSWRDRRPIFDNVDPVHIRSHNSFSDNGSGYYSSTISYSVDVDEPDMIYRLDMDIEGPESSFSKANSFLADAAEAFKRRRFAGRFFFMRDYECNRLPFTSIDTRLYVPRMDMGEMTAALGLLAELNKECPQLSIDGIVEMVRSYAGMRNTYHVTSVAGDNTITAEQKVEGL